MSVDVKIPLDKSCNQGLLSLMRILCFLTRSLQSRKTGSLFRAKRKITQDR